MALVPMDAFEEGTEIVRVYLAASLREARAVEEALSREGVDYAVEVEPYAAPALLSNSARKGAGFWIRESELDRAAGTLERAGHVAGLVRR